MPTLGSSPKIPQEPKPEENETEQKTEVAEDNTDNEGVVGVNEDANSSTASAGAPVPAAPSADYWTETPEHWICMLLCCLLHLTV